MYYAAADKIRPTHTKRFKQLFNIPTHGQKLLKITPNYRKHNASSPVDNLNAPHVGKLPIDLTDLDARKSQNKTNV